MATFSSVVSVWMHVVIGQVCIKTVNCVWQCIKTHSLLIVQCTVTLSAWDYPSKGLNVQVVVQISIVLQEKKSTLFMQLLIVSGSPFLQRLCGMGICC